MLAIVAAVLFLIALVFELVSVVIGPLGATVPARLSLAERAPPSGGFRTGRMR